MLSARWPQASDTFCSQGSLAARPLSLASLWRDRDEAVRIGRICSLQAGRCLNAGESAAWVRVFAGFMSERTQGTACGSTWRVGRLADWTDASSGSGEGGLVAGLRSQSLTTKGWGVAPSPARIPSCLSSASSRRRRSAAFTRAGPAVQWPPSGRRYSARLTVPVICRRSS